MEKTADNSAIVCIAIIPPASSQLLGLIPFIIKHSGNDVKKRHSGQSAG